MQRGIFSEATLDQNVENARRSPAMPKREEGRCRVLSEGRQGDATLIARKSDNIRLGKSVLLAGEAVGRVRRWAPFWQWVNWEARAL